jgi:oligopeptide transport system permease protein
MERDPTSESRWRGPWLDAWKRLRRNRMAVAGLCVVVVVSVTAILAPWISPFDPEAQERWWGVALPPGTRHIELPNEVSLQKGTRPDRMSVPTTAARTLGDGREHVLDVDVQGEKIALLRVTLDGATIQQIGEGGTRHDSVERGERDALRVKDGGAAIAATKLEVGKPAPPEIAAGDGRRVVMLELVRRSVEDRFRAEARYGGDGICTAVTRDGKPVEDELRIAAIAVVDVRLDDRQLTHVHLLGTDQEGRDTLTRVIWGGRISLLIGGIATLVSLIVGVLYGSIAGFAGGRTDVVMMRVVDVLYALPYMFLVILLVSIFQRSMIVLFAALGLVQWLTPSRIVRGQVLSLKRREFVDAARTLGASRWTILTRHLIPNTMGIVVIITTLTIPEVILVESFLSFIGLTVLYEGKPLESWGSLVDYGRQALAGNGDNWWLLVFPAAAMSVTLFSLNFLGDGLRDALDPQQRGRK